MALSRRSVNAAFPTQQPLWLHVKRMAQLYEFVRVESRAPALPQHDLCLTVTRQCSEFSAIDMGLGHRARQALADPLLLGDVVLPEHRRASLVSIQPTPEPRTFHATIRVTALRSYGDSALNWLVSCPEGPCAENK